MLPSNIESQVKAIWNAFWTGGISNPLEVIEQITYLLFLKRLDDLHTLEENKANRLKKPIQRRVFPKGKDGRDRDYNDLRWSNFKHFEAKEIYDVELQHSFVARATKLRALVRAHQYSMVELDSLFASVQSNAFRGELLQHSLQS